MFDPLNTLAIRLLGEELRDQKIHRLEEISPATRKNLISVYATLAKAFPDDPAASAYLARLGKEPPAPVTTTRKGGTTTVVDSARVVRTAVVELAERRNCAVVAQRQAVLRSAAALLGHELVLYVV